MSSYTEVSGNLIIKALEGCFDVIGHGVNCQCTMGAGIAPQMVKAFACNDFVLEKSQYKGDINKLGNIDYEPFFLKDGKAHRGKNTVRMEGYDLYVVNAYTQYNYGRNHTDGDSKPLNYEALTLCMKKINHIFKGKHIGLPGLIGCGLAGGDPVRVKEIIRKELIDCDVTIVYLQKNDL